MVRTSIDASKPSLLCTLTTVELCPIRRAMQDAWRFVEDLVQRERLEASKGIGTPATRAAVLEG